MPTGRSANTVQHLNRPSPPSPRTRRLRFAGVGLVLLSATTAGLLGQMETRPSATSSTISPTLNAARSPSMALVAETRATQSRVQLPVGFEPQTATAAQPSVAMTPDVPVTAPAQVNPEPPAETPAETSADTAAPPQPQIAAGIQLAGVHGIAPMLTCVPNAAPPEPEVQTAEEETPPYLENGFYSPYFGSRWSAPHHYCVARVCRILPAPPPKPDLQPAPEEDSTSPPEPAAAQNGCRSAEPPKPVPPNCLIEVLDPLNSCHTLSEARAVTLDLQQFPLGSVVLMPDGEPDMEASVVQPPVAVGEAYADTPIFRVTKFWTVTAPSLGRAAVFPAFLEAFQQLSPGNPFTDGRAWLVDGMAEWAQNRSMYFPEATEDTPLHNPNNPTFCAALIRLAADALPVSPKEPPPPTPTEMAVAGIPGLMQSPRLQALFTTDEKRRLFSVILGLSKGTSNSALINANCEALEHAPERLELFDEISTGLDYSASEKTAYGIECCRLLLNEWADPDKGEGSWNVDTLIRLIYEMDYTPAYPLLDAALDRTTAVSTRIIILNGMLWRQGRWTWPRVQTFFADGMQDYRFREEILSWDSPAIDALYVDAILQTKDLHGREQLKQLPLKRQMPMVMQLLRGGLIQAVIPLPQAVTRRPEVIGALVELLDSPDAQVRALAQGEINAAIHKPIANAESFHAWHFGLLRACPYEAAAAMELTPWLDQLAAPAAADREVARARIQALIAAPEAELTAHPTTPTAERSAPLERARNLQAALARCATEDPRLTVRQAARELLYSVPLELNLFSTQEVENGASPSIGGHLGRRAIRRRGR